MKKQLGEAAARIGELDQTIKRLYEDNVLGKNSGERFDILSAEYEAEQKELRERSSAIESELQQAKEASADIFFTFLLLLYGTRAKSQGMKQVMAN